ncbi:MAG TPA: uroporphyrinogen-III synthase [Nitrospiraceae bacterium]|nr:uroporphyrinogen-III synthase [Nitrospiraceae bacterium]
MPKSPDRQITKSNFAGLAVAAFESRMAAEMARLIERYGGRPYVAASMREVPLQSHTEVFAFGERLLRGDYDMVILLTGVGARTLLDVLTTRYPLDVLTSALARVKLVTRGPKSLAVLKELGLTASLTVPEPNTWKDLLEALDTSLPPAGLRVAVQEYGVSNTDLLRGLAERGAQVDRVPVYRWALPEDTAPLIDLIDRILMGNIDVLLITNAVQVDHVMHLLRDSTRFDRGTDRFRHAAGHMVVASVGPTVSERLRHDALPVDLEPSHPRMGVLVKEASERAHSILQTKRLRH